MATGLVRHNRTIGLRHHNTATGQSCYKKISSEAADAHLSPHFMMLQQSVPLDCNTLLLGDSFMTLTLMIRDSGPFSRRTMFRFSKLKPIGLSGLGMVPVRSLLWQNWNWPRWSGDGANQIIIGTKMKLASVVWGWCQSDHYCDKNEIGLGGLGMVPIRTLLWQKWNWPGWFGDGANQIVIVAI